MLSVESAIAFFLCGTFLSVVAGWFWCERMFEHALKHHPDTVESRRLLPAAWPKMYPHNRGFINFLRSDHKLLADEKLSRLCRTTYRFIVLAYLCIGAVFVCGAMSSLR